MIWGERMMYRGLVFFFFKQKTAYEIRPRDWSSDVCSSDLLPFRVALDLISADHGDGEAPTAGETPGRIPYGFRSRPRRYLLRCGRLQRDTNWLCEPTRGAGRRRDAQGAGSDERDSV